jgi:6-phospho-beta-glucosidase
MGLKIAVIGAASSYTPEIFADLADFRRQLEVDQVALMDPNADKLALIAEVGRKVLREANLPAHVVAMQSLEQAIAGADFIILQIRVGGLQARIRDETLPMEFGMVGNETTGAGGFMCGLRTVTAALRIAETIERVAPRAWVLNLSNPAGIVTEALLQHTALRTVGFCNIPINTTYEFADVLGVPPEKIALRSFGLNHLSWVREVLVEGEDKLQPLMSATQDRNSILYKHGLVEDLMDPRWLKTLGMVPSWYVRYYYWTEEVLAQDRRSQHTKGTSDMEAEQGLRALYLSEGYGDKVRQILASKGGAQYYLPVLQVASAVAHDSGQVVVCDVRNGNSLPDLPLGVCVEVPARVNRNGIEPLPVGHMPLSVRGLVQTVKAYEQLTVEAAISGSHEAALTALATHPLVGSYTKACQFWGRALDHEREFIPQFFPGA